MKKIWKAIFILPLVTYGCATASATSGTCRDASDPASKVWLAYVHGVVTRTDAVAADERSHYLLTGVSDSTVTLVTDEATCAQVLSSYNAKEQTPDSVRSLVVIKAGDRYIGLDPADTHGEFVDFMIFDSTYVFLAGFSG